MAAVYPCDWQRPIKSKSGTKSMGKRVSLLKRRIQGFRYKGTRTTAYMLWLTTYARSVAGQLLSLSFAGAIDNGSLLRESLLVYLYSLPSN
ncbi:hypothetical protein AVEN_66806-1 [Araneus ventricosus]|uniref:Uncharacterized protein n=1 Tax=Araneus ventricosus TaxID=182803 RepID=A0A4Y2DQJ7_ARAVE|nr:hypothetical protein AVEN_66806-1 [Araneus ventricosus]